MRPAAGRLPSPEPPKLWSTLYADCTRVRSGVTPGGAGLSGAPLPPPHPANIAAARHVLSAKLLKSRLFMWSAPRTVDVTGLGHPSAGAGSVPPERSDCI